MSDGICEFGVQEAVRGPKGVGVREQESKARERITCGGAEVAQAVCYAVASPVVGALESFGECRNHLGGAETELAKAGRG